MFLSVFTWEMLPFGIKMYVNALLCQVHLKEYNVVLLPLGECYGLSCVPHLHSYFAHKPPGPQNVNLFGNRILADVIGLSKKRSYMSSMAPNPVGAVSFILKKRGNLDIDTRMGR